MTRQPHTYSDVRGTWDVYQLWHYAADLPVEVVPRQDLEHHLDDECWGKGAMTPRDVLYHIARIEKSDLDYPIILSQHGVVMDGMHRIAKAVLFDVPYVKVRKFAVDPPPTEPKP
jgi:hypothetical protein